MTTAAHILIVDDDPTLLKLLNTRLKLEGYRITPASSGEEALAKFAIERPQLVITDMQMGGMDGLALFENIHRIQPALPVIMLTAHGTIPAAVDATQRGMFSYLSKPFEGEALLAQVRKALGTFGDNGANAETPANGDAGWRAEIISRSTAMEDLLAEARLVAVGAASVLITGPSGAGKELLARAIHAASPRCNGEMVAINCGAIPEQLLESELFGHVKGAFTGAHRDHDGLFQTADKGTLFLDEIGDMPLALQVKLLRVLQERKVRPVGSARTHAVDVRLICATHRDLPVAVREGAFREDLFYRINVVNLDIPPLARRREDIPLLASHFLSDICTRYGRATGAFAPEALEELVRSEWPGNVRQLYNVVEQCVARATSPVISAALVQRALQREDRTLEPFDEARRGFERDYLVKLLRMTEGNVTQAARLAKRNRSDFYSLLSRNQIDPASFKHRDA
jgi:two-component system response regulator GlrR